ncbi:NAD(P)-dependent alcohol dehydrogenase [Comamonas serinivorans]|uniref:NAD(P)-dependent alcohol dehydrogenase n=1 Tax=Comamonas serinivorans TaxID=1082851 RepID=A0A1Y0ELX0_9BURK|nr:NAD(P)-dependent alcohol dehydrogenase [Comamonas serinivorans]ARU04654.1 NAD(P)-dependent alcohol dehydrogenase [Comamonas serinivorans]
MKIQAALTPEAHAPFQLQEVELDTPRAGEILVRIVGVGLCHTDLAATQGIMPLTFPAVLGHEGAGVVEQIGEDVRKVQVGDRVTISFASCGHCAHCAHGDPAYCHTMGALNYAGVRPDGSKSLRQGDTQVSGNFFGQSSFASHALTRERNVVKVPDDVPLEIAGTLGCGIQTGAGAVMRSFACPAGSSLLVTGGGAVGLSAVMAAVVQGCRTILVVEPNAARREMALSLGATHVIDPAAHTDLAAAVRAIEADGVDFMLDTSGQPAVIAIAPQVLIPKGTFGFVGIPPLHAVGMSLPGTLIEAMGKGFTYRGIIEGDSDPDVFIPQLIDLFRQGRFPFDRLITTYPLADINRAVAEQHQGLCIKPVLLP